MEEAQIVPVQEGLPLLVEVVVLCLLDVVASHLPQRLRRHAPVLELFEVHENQVLRFQLPARRVLAAEVLLRPKNEPRGLTEDS